MNEQLRNSAATIRDYDNNNYVHAWEAMWLAGKADRTISTSAEGIYVYDENGRKLIDGPAGMWCTQIGNGRKDMAEAIAEQVMTLSYYSPWNTTAEPAAVLAHKLAQLAPGDLNHVFLTTGGSTAVDSALRFAQFYNNLLGRPEKKMIISREGAYHGSTYLAASVTGKERDKTMCDTEKRLVHFLPDVDPHLRSEGVSLDDWRDAKVKDLEDAILELGPDKVAVFIAEPVLASGGVIVPPKGYHKACLAVCRKYDVLYISDEVVTGFGRLGHWFASESEFDIVPDIIICAKGLTSGYLPLGACIISDKIYNQITGPDREDIMFTNGYTYSGHPVSCAAALKNIEIIENEGILEHVRELSPYFQERLADFNKYSIVGNTRGIGLIGGIDGTQDDNKGDLKLDKDIGYRLDVKCEQLGLIVRPLYNMCVFSPPLIITRDQVDEMFDILDRAIREVTADLGR